MAYLNAAELAVINEALAMPSEHDSHGCPAPRFYKSIASLPQETRVAKELWMAAYDDGRTCPMQTIHQVAEKLLKENNES